MRGHGRRADGRTGTVSTCATTRQIGTIGLSIEGHVRDEPLPQTRKREKKTEMRSVPDEIQTSTRRTPIGRELSTNTQSSEVHRHAPAMGSQKGVEQLAGTGSGTA